MVEDFIIHSARSSAIATLHDLISSGTWILRSYNPHHHHVSTSLLDWCAEFDYPALDLLPQGRIFWNVISSFRVPVGDIWDCIQATKPALARADDVWLRLGVSRNPFLSWLLYMN